MPKHIQAELGPSLWESAEHSQPVQSCSVIVGLHPDQVRHKALLVSCAACELTARQLLHVLAPACPSSACILTRCGT